MPMHGPSLAETTPFVAVVELKSFTKAAKQLALSPPRVSEMVRNLEDRLGVRLVERTTRSVAPTAAGERLLARLRPALDEYQAALEPTNEFRGKPAGTLRLTALHRSQRPIFFWPRPFRAFWHNIPRFPSICPLATL
jgi:DNA-binding transcriptional LysR family regulator